MDDSQELPTPARLLSLPGLVIGSAIIERAALHPIETDRLVTLEGVTGIFTPIAGTDGGAEGDQNLQAIIGVLRAEIGDLRGQLDGAVAERDLYKQRDAERARIAQEMEALHAKVAALESENQDLKLALQKPPRLADDLASAVAHSVDSLQTRMAGLTNPVSNFAVREFSIDAKVQIDVTPLGTVEYRFIQPGDRVEASQISNVSMTLVPIPRPDATGTYTRADFTPLVPIEDIQGIGEAYRKRLNAHEIYTVNDLLTAGTRVRGSVALATLLDVDRERLGEWLSHAQLMTVRTIDGRAAELLYDLGIHSLEALASADPADLTARYNQRVGQLDRQTLAPQSPAAVADWVRAARAFVGSPGAAQPSG